jgi:nicotinamidase-related amidase
MTPHAQVPRSKRVLLLIDFINPLDFPGADKLAPPALPAARAAARLRERFDRDQAAVVYANDNYGVWQSDFHSLVAQCISRDDTSGEIARLLAPRATDMCVQMTAADAFLRGFSVWVPSDCTAAETPAAKAASLKYMREVLKCDVRSSRVRRA